MNIHSTVSVRRVFGAMGFATLFACSAQVFAQDYGNFTLGAGFLPDPQTGTGVTGGPVDASNYSNGCRGWIDQTPDHHINVTSDVNLTLTVSSSTDSTLVVVGPSGVFCDDDSAGNLDARVSARLQSGRYSVYIGNYSQGNNGRYTLILTER